MITSPCAPLSWIGVLQSGEPKLCQYLVYYQTFTPNPKSLWWLPNVDFLFSLILYFLMCCSTGKPSFLFSPIHFCAYGCTHLNCIQLVLICHYHWFWYCPRMVIESLQASSSVFWYVPLFFKLFLLFFDTTSCTRLILHFFFFNPKGDFLVPFSEKMVFRPRSGHSVYLFV